MNFHELYMNFHEKTSGERWFLAHKRQNGVALMDESSKINFLCFIHQSPRRLSAAISPPEEKNLPAAGKKPASQEKILIMHYRLGGRRKWGRGVSAPLKHWPLW